MFYVSKYDKANTMTTKEIFKLNVRPSPPFLFFRSTRLTRLLRGDLQMTRPFVLLFKEPIVLLLSIYIAIV